MKRWLYLNVFALRRFLHLKKYYVPRVYMIPRVITYRAKLNNSCFCHFTVAILVSLRGTPTWGLQTKLYKFVWNVSPNISLMKNYTDQNLCKVVYIWEFYLMPDSWIRLLNVFDFIFDGAGDTCKPPIIGQDHSCRVRDNGKEKFVQTVTSLLKQICELFVNCLRFGLFTCSMTDNWC